jgi:UrcA family protein
MSRLLAAAAAAALLAGAAPALAQVQHPESRVVSYADLDLEDPADADAFIARIERAAGEVCGDRTGPRPIAEISDTRDCAYDTTEFAIEDFGHPMVLGRYHGFTPDVVIEGSWDPEQDPYYTVKPKA